MMLNLVLLATLGMPLSGDEGKEKGHHLSEVSFPLYSKEVGKKYIQLRKDRIKDGMPWSELPSAIDFATSMEDAVKRATAEDKPILVLTFVRENGDPACDV